MQHLGQHFLKNEGAIKKIVAAIAPQKGETIIEIGPGRGALTIPLLEACQKVGAQLIAIEKDRALARELTTYDKRLTTKIIEGDALKILPDLIQPYTLDPKPYTLIGNIPYYITGYLLRIISELEPRPKKIVFMLQREVAERICAVPPKMNLLAASVQFWAKPKILFTLPPTDFDPAPKVSSAVIEINSEPRTENLEQSEKYYQFIKAAFRQPRKTLLNNLLAGLNNETIRHSERKEKSDAPPRHPERSEGSIRKLDPSVRRLAEPQDDTQHNSGMLTRAQAEGLLKTLGLPINCRPQDLSIKQLGELASVV